MIKLIRRTRARCYRTAKVLGDVQAVLQGRVAHRIVQRQAGKHARRGLNKLTRKLLR